MLHESSRSAGLRRPQSGTPGPPSLGGRIRTELVGDAVLLDIGMQSAGCAWLCGLLLRAQIRAYSATGHIISYADDFVLRKIKNHARVATIPNIHVRCMRCGCRALMLDWIVVADLVKDPITFERRYTNGDPPTIDIAFFKECQGNEKMEEALILMD